MPASAARAPLLAAVDFEYRRVLHGLADDPGHFRGHLTQVLSPPCCASCSPQARALPQEEGLSLLCRPFSDLLACLVGLRHAYRAGGAWSLGVLQGSRDPWT